MKVILSLYLWTIGILYFGLICIIGILLTFFIPNEKLDPWIKKRCRTVFKLLHIKVEVEGTEMVDPETTYLFMANHVSSFDIPLLEAFIPVFFRGVEAKHHFNWPVFGWAIRRLCNIPIDRENNHASFRSIQKTEGWLRRKRPIVILPEGYRTLDGKLMTFKRLPFYLAKQAEVDIVPMGLSGLFHLNRKGSWLIQPTTVKVKFGKPITTDQSKHLSVDELKTLTRLNIQTLIEYA